MDCPKKTEPLIETNHFAGKDLNCAETILAAANETYKWELQAAALRLSAGFGGGIGGQELLCGALTGGVMALSNLFVRERAHESALIKNIIQEYFTLFEKEMGSIECAPLKTTHRTEQDGCKSVIQASARCMDRIVERNKDKLILNSEQ